MADLMLGRVSIDPDGIKLWNYSGGSTYRLTLTNPSMSANYTQTFLPVTGTVMTSTGSFSDTDCVEWDTATGSFITTGAPCGSAPGGGDDVSADGTNVVDPNFIDTATINVTADTAASPDTVALNVIDSSITSSKIADNTITRDDLGPTLALQDGDLLSFALVDPSTTAEGLILPQAASCSASATAEGQVCWEANTDSLWIGTGSSRVSKSGDIESVWSCTAGGCTDIAATASTHKLRASTLGFLGAKYTITNKDDNDPCTAVAGWAAGDMLWDASDDEFLVCGPDEQLHTVTGVAGGSSITVQEDDGSTRNNQSTLDFGAGLDVTADGANESDISVDMTEVPLTINTMWTGSGLTLGKATQTSIPQCVGADEKLSYTAAISGDRDAEWTCDNLSTSATALVLDNDGGVAGDGVDPEIYVSGGTTIHFDPNGSGGGGGDWRMTSTAITPAATINTTLGDDTHPIEAGYFCTLPTPTSGCGTTLTLSGDPDNDGIPDTVIELGNPIKFYFGEGASSPSYCMAAGGQDGDCDGIADNTLSVSRPTTGPNYSQSFSSETSVTLIHNLGSNNLMTACYDASDAQITPASVTIGASAPYNVSVTFASPQTGRCVVNAGAGGKYYTTFVAQTEIEIADSTLRLDPYKAQVVCYDDSTPRTRIEPDSTEIDEMSNTMTIKFFSAQSGRCTVF